MITTEITFTSNLSIYAFMSIMLKDKFSPKIIKELLLDRFPVLKMVRENPTVKEKYNQWKKAYEEQQRMVREADFENAGVCRRKKMRHLSDLSSCISAFEPELPFCSGLEKTSAVHYFEDMMRLLFE